jgi:hypothetical protein
MTTSRAALWQRLVDAGLVSGPLPDRTEPASPWFVRIMLGVAGWIGALFLLGFVGVGLAFVFRSEATALFVGALCCAAAYAVFARAGRNELALQFGLAVSFAGQVMFIYGLHEGLVGSQSPIFFVLVAAFEGALAYLFASFIHRVWSTFAAATALGYALNMFGLYGVGTALIGGTLGTIWLKEELWAARGAFWRAAAWGLAFAFVQPTSYLDDVGRSMRPLDPTFQIAGIVWIKSILAVGVLIFVVYKILERYGVEIASTTGVASLAASAGIGAATLRAPGIASSLVIVLLGFASGSRALFGFGIVAMLSYLSHFYYSLQLTLLMKSMALAGTGVALVVMWAVMRIVFPQGPEVRGSEGSNLRRFEGS